MQRTGRRDSCAPGCVAARGRRAAGAAARVLRDAATLVVDEGVYSSAALAMRDGALPFRQVFSAQGPLHLPLVYVFDLLGGRTLDSPRLVVGRRRASSSRSRSTRSVAASARASRALLAAALVATTGSILWTTAPLTGDGPAAAFTALAVLGAFAWRDEPSSARAILTGVAMGAALAVKVLVAVAAIPIGLVFVLRTWRAACATSRRRSRPRSS